MRASRGFDIDLIEQKCIDVQDHPILGKGYRVAVTSKYQDEQHVERQVENVSLSNNQPQVKHHGVVRNKEAIDAVKEAARQTQAMATQKQKKISKAKKMASKFMP